MSSVYQVNKGINKAIEFRGVKAQYIGYLAGVLVALLLLFAILYICGVNTWVCLILIGGTGTGLVTTIFRLSHKYGQYGLQKKSAKRSLPNYLKFRSRKLFIHLTEQSDLLSAVEKTIYPRKNIKVLPTGKDLGGAYDKY